MAPNFTVPIKDVRVNGVVRFYQRGDHLVGVFDVKTRDGGALRLELSVPVRPIEAQIARQAGALPSAAREQLDHDRVSGLDPRRAVRRLANRVAKNRLTARLERILSHPAAPLANEVAEQLVPGWGATYGAVRAAASLLRRAKRRDPEAAAKLAEVARDAGAGEPRGVEAQQLLNRVARQLTAGDAAKGAGAGAAGDNVGGWLFNTPYRSVFRATLEPSPGVVHRALYKGGLSKRAELARR